MPAEWRVLQGFNTVTWPPATSTGGAIFYGPGNSWSNSTSTTTVSYTLSGTAITSLWNQIDMACEEPLMRGTIYPPSEARPHGPARPPSPATTRARELLTGFLNPLQLAQYEESGKFDIVGSDGTLYRIGPGTNGNVEWLDPATGGVKGRLCAHPRSYDYENRSIPEPDLHLGQLLALTTDERAWLEVANLHRGEWPPTHHARQLVHAAA